jgi:ribosome-associated protein
VEDLRVNDQLVIPAAELQVRTSRAGGPGGQHVNTASTRVSLRWSVRDSAVLSEAQRALLLEALEARLTGEGELLVHAADSRSQSHNLQLARERLAEAVRQGLERPPPRRPTRPGRAARHRRLDGKRRRGALKQGRGRVREEEP